MIKIGHVDLGTNHPPRFVEMEKELGYLPYGVFDDFRIVDENYLKEFAEKYDLKIFKSLEDMADEVDMAFIHSVNWDLHYERILPFVEKGKGVYIDKPVCGSAQDIERISSLAGHSRITGGSMVIYADEIKELKGKECKFTDSINIIFAGGPNHIFYYGIHVIYMVCAVLGYDIEYVRYIGESGQKFYEISWINGKKAVVSLGDTKRFYPFHMTLVSDEGVKQYSIKGFLALKNMLQTVIPYLYGGENGTVNIEKLLNCEKAANAALESEIYGGVKIHLSRIDKGINYNGKAFENVYRVEAQKN